MHRREWHKHGIHPNRWTRPFGLQVASLRWLARCTCSSSHHRVHRLCRNPNTTRCRRPTEHKRGFSQREVPSRGGLRAEPRRCSGGLDSHSVHRPQVGRGRRNPNTWQSRCPAPHSSCWNRPRASGHRLGGPRQRRRVRHEAERRLGTRSGQGCRRGRRPHGRRLHRSRARRSTSLEPRWPRAAPRRRASQGSATRRYACWPDAQAPIQPFGELTGHAGQSSGCRRLPWTSAPWRPSRLGRGPRSSRHDRSAPARTRCRGPRGLPR